MEKFVRCENCGAMVKVLIDCKCDNCGIKCCNEPMKEISEEKESFNNSYAQDNETVKNNLMKMNDFLNQKT